MSLVQNINDLRAVIDRMDANASKQQMIYFNLIEGVVRIRQHCRMAMSYAVADELRALLESVGVEIIQGTAGYEYENIPPALRGRQIDDTWKMKVQA